MSTTLFFFLEDQIGICSTAQIEENIIPSTEVNELTSLGKNEYLRHLLWFFFYIINLVIKLAPYTPPISSSYLILPPLSVALFRFFYFLFFNFVKFG